MSLSINEFIDFLIFEDMFNLHSPDRQHLWCPESDIDHSLLSLRSVQKHLSQSRGEQNISRANHTVTPSAFISIAVAPSYLQRQSALTKCIINQNEERKWSFGRWFRSPGVITGALSLRSHQHNTHALFIHLNIWSNTSSSQWIPNWNIWTEKKLPLSDFARSLLINRIENDINHDHNLATQIIIIIIIVFVLTRGAFKCLVGTQFTVIHERKLNYRWLRVVHVDFFRIDIEE